MILAKKYLLFDLDGTIINSSKGIFSSINYAMRQLKKDPLEVETLRMFVGPPLLDSFKKIGLDEKEAQEAVVQYRVLYTKQGMFEVMPYDRMEKVLATLATKYQLFLATAKPQPFAERILAHLKFTDYFSGIYGADLKGIRSSKSAVIQALLSEEKIKAPEQVLMIGDRNDDVLGAKSHSIDTLGVLYGFGDEKELLTAGAKWLVHTPLELLDIL